MQDRVGVAFTGLKVQRFKVPFSSLDYNWDAYLGQKCQLRQIYSKFGAKLAIIWKNEHLYQDVGSLMPSFSLTLNVEPWTCERLQVV